MDEIKIAELIFELNKSRQVSFENTNCRANKYTEEYTGIVILSNGEQISISIAFNDHFPSQIPDLYVNGLKDFRVHVGADGKICLFDTSAILLKSNMPGQIIIDCYDQALSILNLLPGTKGYQEELCREFSSYWAMVKTIDLYSILDLYSIRFAELPIVVRDGLRLLAESKSEAEAFLHNSFNLKNTDNSFELKSLIIRLRDGSYVPKLEKTFKWSTIRRYILDNCSASIKKQFQKYIKRKVLKPIRYLLLILPSNYGEILFGFRLEFHNSRLCSIENSVNCSVENVFCNRIDYNYLTVRGGADPVLRNKKVLLLGSGSIGGYVASDLCQAGITTIDILDNDCLRPDNVYRHYLGFDCIRPGKLDFKANLMKVNLEKKYPYVNIDPMNFVDRDVETFLSDIDQLKHYDLIISALGEPTINLELNKILTENRIRVPLIVCFNEPYGIGGHIIVTNLDSNSCLQCLYTDSISNEIVAFRGSFVKEDQNFNKSFSGCAGSFVPYSCLDSQYTALLTTRKSIEVLTYILKSNVVLSWLGKADGFMAQGFNPSERYFNNAEKSTIQISSFANNNCPICKTSH